MKISIRKKQLLQAAKEMFVEMGYNETTIRKLTSQLNIKAAAFYNHFQSKDDLLDTICKDVSFRFRMIRLDLENAEIDAKEKLNQFITRYITEIFNDILAFKIYLRYWDINEHFVSKYTEGRDLFVEFVKKIFDELNIKANLHIYKTYAPIHMFLASMNVLPSLIRDPQEPNIKLLVKDFQNKLTTGFHENNLRYCT